MVQVKSSDLLTNLNDYDDSQVIFSPDGSFPKDGNVFLLTSEESEEADDKLKYVLELYLVSEILDVWSKWRNSKLPTAEEKIKAINYYVQNDAYIPV